MKRVSYFIESCKEEYKRNKHDSHLKIMTQDGMSNGAFVTACHKTWSGIQVQAMLMQSFINRLNGRLFDCLQIHHG